MPWREKKTTVGVHSWRGGLFTQQLKKWVKAVFLLGCDGCIFHGTGNSAQLCQNFGISGGGVWNHPLGTPLDGTYIRRWSRKGRFTLYVMFPFRRGTSPFSKMFSCVIKRNVHTDRNMSVTSQFRSVAVAERECLTWWNVSEPVCTCSIPIMWTVLRLLHNTSTVFL